MRARIGAVVRDPSALPAWWIELPGRRAGWWRWLLFESGQGWLRWGMEWRREPHSWDPPIPGEWYRVAPPARRLMELVWGNLRLNLWALIHDRSAFGWEGVGDLRDSDRKRGTL